MAMDVERTIEFILQSQANAEARLGRVETQTKATADLVREGMKIVQALARDQRETRQQLRALRQDVGELTKDVGELTKNARALHQDMLELANAQIRTEKTLDRYLKSLSNGHNGRRK